MYVPRVRSGFDVPRPLITGLAATCASLTAILLAGLFTRSTSDDSPAVPLPLVAATEGPGSLVYAISSGSYDRLYVQEIEGEGERRRIASFPVLIGLHIRGAVSPGTGQVAVLHLESGGGADARLSLVDTATGDIRDVDASFDYLSRLAWSSDGGRLALVQRLPSADPTRGFSVHEVDMATLAVTQVAAFEQAIEVAPVGYDEEGLLAVTVDSSGSSLWRLDGGAPELLTTFSRGLTGDWSLGPAGQKLAFIEHLGAGDRSRAGRVLDIATGRVTDVVGTGEQLGAAWKPGAATPDFGGPAGTVLLSEEAERSYLVPLTWTLDGVYLVATVLGLDELGAVVSNTIELVTTGGRFRLGDGGPATFFGLVP